MQSIFDRIDLEAAAAPMRPAILTLDGGVTYGELVAGIASVQGVLDRMNLDREAPVGVLINLPMQFAVVALALLKSGFAVMPLRAGLLDPAVVAGAKTIITDRQIQFHPGVRNLAFDARWLGERTAPRPFARLPDNRIVAITFTSGSTGRPKAIGFTAQALSHRILNSYRSPAHQYARTLSLRGISSSGFQFIRTLASGNTLLFAPMAMAETAAVVMQPQALLASAVQGTSLLNHQKSSGGDLSFTHIEVNGGQISEVTRTELERQFRSQLALTYGSTEASRAGICFGALLGRRASLGNCYWPVATVEVVRPDLSVAPRGNEGLIRVRSDSMGWPFAGSLTQTEDAKGDGWFYPGDIGYLSDDGMFVVTGRSDDVINDGGVKYSAELMEDILKRHPEIADAGILRVGSSALQTEAWVVAAPKGSLTLHDLNAWVRRTLEGELASVQFARLVLVDEVPRTTTGKVARAQLRKLLEGS